MIVVPKIGIPYDVQVQARNSLDPPELGTWSVSQEETPVASTLPAAAAPATPTKTAANSSSIVISWTAVTGAAKYRVRYKTGTDDWGEPVEVAAATQYNAVMLDASTTYRFEVGAYGDGAARRPAWGAWSTQLEASTSAAADVNGCITSLGAISGTSTLQGAWTDECVSSNRRLGTKYARYFSFQLATAADLTIELVSGEDPYLILMEGAGTSGTMRARNDDSGDDGLGHFNSRITYQATAGNYTAEATPYNSNTTGDFTISIEVLNVPSAPRNVTVVPGNNRLVVLWDPPETDRGSAITGYRVGQQASSGSQSRSRRSVVDPSRLLGADDRGYAILNLSNGTSYSVTVVAVNGNGDGDPFTAPATAPQETTITVTAPDTLEVGSSDDVGVITTGTVTGADYRVRLDIDDPTKISFNGCSPQDDLEILQNLTATATVHGCAAGTGNVTATLVVQDTQGDSYPIVASSATHAIRVTQANQPPTFDQTSYRFAIPDHAAIGAAIGTVVASDADMDTITYEVGRSTAVQIDADGNLTVAASLEALGGSEHEFEVKADDGVNPVQTVDVTLNGLTPPHDIRANGESDGLSAGRIKLRWEGADNVQQFEVSYADEVFALPSLSVMRMATDQETEIGSLGFNTLYRVQIASVENGVRSSLSEPLVVYTTDGIPPRIGSANPRIATIELKALNVDHEYAYTICTNKFPNNTWVAEMKSALQAWENQVVWELTNGDNMVSLDDQGDSSNCPSLVGRPDPNDPTKTIYDEPWGEIRRSDDMMEFEALCGSGAYACAKQSRITRRGGVTYRLPYFKPAEAPFIMFRRDMSTAAIGPWDPGVDKVVNGVSSGCSNFYQTAVHEVGHAYGFGHATIDSSRDVSIMEPGRDRLHCNPKLYDVAAMMALYQSHDIGMLPPGN